MSGWIRKVRAGAVVSLAFGVAWGTIVWLSFLGAMLVTSGLGGLQLIGTSVLLMLGMWIVIGVVHGALVAAAMSLTGGKWTVDTFPRWLGALIGGGIGAGGWLLMVLLQGVGGPGAIAASTVMSAMTGLFGAVTTTTLLTVARRGALPPVPREPGQIRP